MNQPSADHDTRQRRADATRNRTRLIKASIDVLAERPNASMDEIAAAAGLGRATLYRHFASRRDLILKIQQTAVSDAAAALADVDLADGPAVAALGRAVSALIGIGNRYRLLGSQADLDRGVLAATPDVAEPLIALIARGQESGEIRTDLPPAWILPSLAALMLLALKEMGADRLNPEQARRYVTASLISGLEVKPGAQLG